MIPGLSAIFRWKLDCMIAYARREGFWISTENMLDILLDKGWEVYA